MFSITLGFDGFDQSDWLLKKVQPIRVLKNKHSIRLRLKCFIVSGPDADVTLEGWNMWLHGANRATNFPMIVLLSGCRCHMHSCVGTFTVIRSMTLQLQFVCKIIRLLRGTSMDSVTRLQYYFSIFCLLEQWNFVQNYKIFAKVGLTFC